MWGVKRFVVVLAVLLAVSSVCSGMEAEVGRDVAGRQADILMIQPLTDGKVEVNLKQAAALTELEPGILTSAKALKHTLDLKAERTYLFKQTDAPADSRPLVP